MSTYPTFSALLVFMFEEIRSRRLLSLQVHEWKNFVKASGVMLLLDSSPCLKGEGIFVRSLSRRSMNASP